MRLSIIIANYNHCNFVGDAITSALAVEWSDREVIVVDDESTDDSKSVIQGFGNRVAAYFRPKSNQLGAQMFGFEQSSGEVVILLDADDLLEPQVMREVAIVWRPGVSKVQYRMNLIDAGGRQLGTAIPQFPPTDDPERLRRTYLSTMAYTTPPGSGNAYSREFVGMAYATVRENGFCDALGDDILLTLAPILGDVLTIRKPLARYRIHGTNATAMRSLDAQKIRNRLYQDLEKARLFTTVASHLRLPIQRDILIRSQGHLQYRLASYLVDPKAHPFPADTMPRLVYHLVLSTVKYPQLRMRHRAILLGWVLACLLLPQHYRRNLVLWRFAPTSRPILIKRILDTVASLRSSRLPDRA
jgi:glycosyltransferase involved in cell wall biosynthesis